MSHVERTTQLRVYAFKKANVDTVIPHYYTVSRIMQSCFAQSTVTVRCGAVCSISILSSAASRLSCNYVAAKVWTQYWRIPVYPIAIKIWCSTHQHVHSWHCNRHTSGLTNQWVRAILYNLSYNFLSSYTAAAAVTANKDLITHPN